jgi:PKD repeat protein
MTSTGAPTEWLWSFGDGGTSTTSALHQYQQAGAYAVSLTVTNGLAPIPRRRPTS